MIDQLLRQRLEVAARLGRGEQELEQLVIRQRRGAGIEQPLAQALAVAEVMRLLLGNGGEEAGIGEADRGGRRLPAVA